MTVHRAGIVLFGGFASPSSVYAGFARALSEVTGQAVYVVGAETYHWAASIVPRGWVVLLSKLHETVLTAAAEQGGTVTLIGHSAGGVLARLYLAPTPTFGRVYRGIDRVSALVTLGSPHANQRRWLHGGMMSRWIEKRHPGACYADHVRYISVAGRLVRGNRRGPPRERRAYTFYKRIAGEGDVWGDGLIPVSSALLAGSHAVVLDGVGHFGGQWYGSRDVLRQWWASVAPDTH
ncbi:MAG: hypothetical protein JXA09_16070 [Anaerolineae bacterium]|nr:hypothetical protein [Anaerolineae bacterium]